MKVKPKQVFVSSKSDRFIRVERIESYAKESRNNGVEIVDVEYIKGKFTKIKGTNRILIADSIRRHYLPVQL